MKVLHASIPVLAGLSLLSGFNACPCDKGVSKLHLDVNYVPRMLDGDSGSGARCNGEEYDEMDDADSELRGGGANGPRGGGRNKRRGGRKGRKADLDDTDDSDEPNVPCGPNSGVVRCFKFTESGIVQVPYVEAPPVEKKEDPSAYDREFCDVKDLDKEPDDIFNPEICPPCSSQEDDPEEEKPKVGPTFFKEDIDCPQRGRAPGCRRNKSPWTGYPKDVRNEYPTGVRNGSSGKDAERCAKKPRNGNAEKKGPCDAWKATKAKEKRRKERAAAPKEEEDDCWKYIGGGENGTPKTYRNRKGETLQRYNGRSKDSHINVISKECAPPVKQKC